MRTRRVIFSRPAPFWHQEKLPGKESASIFADNRYPAEQRHKYFEREKSGSALLFMNQFISSRDKQLFPRRCFSKQAKASSKSLATTFFGLEIRMRRQIASVAEQTQARRLVKEYRDWLAHS
jgi:hypothetical protein